jgi:hypothetical protein
MSEYPSISEQRAFRAYPVWLQEGSKKNFENAPLAATMENGGVDDIKNRGSCTARN